MVVWSLVTSLVQQQPGRLVQGQDQVQGQKQAEVSNVLAARYQVRRWRPSQKSKFEVGNTSEQQT